MFPCHQAAHQHWACRHSEVCKAHPKTFLIFTTGGEGEQEEWKYALLLYALIQILGRSMWHSQSCGIILLAQVGPKTTKQPMLRDHSPAQAGPRPTEQHLAGMDKCATPQTNNHHTRTKRHIQQHPWCCHCK